MQQEPFDLSGADREFEQALGHIQLAGHAIDRDHMMFEAGRASTRKTILAWRAGSAVLVLVMGVSLSWIGRPVLPHEAVLPVEMTGGVVASPQVAVSSAGCDQASYAVVRNRVLEEGVEALPRFHSGAPLRMDRADDALLLGRLQHSDS